MHMKLIYTFVFINLSLIMMVESFCTSTKGEEIRIDAKNIELVKILGVTGFSRIDFNSLNLDIDIFKSTSKHGAKLFNLMSNSSNTYLISTKMHQIIKPGSEINFFSPNDIELFYAEKYNSEDISFVPEFIRKRIQENFTVLTKSSGSKLYFPVSIGDKIIIHQLKNRIPKISCYSGTCMKHSRDTSTIKAIFKSLYFSNKKETPNWFFHYMKPKFKCFFQPQRIKNSHFCTPPEVKDDFYEENLVYDKIKEHKELKVRSYSSHINPMNQDYKLLLSSFLKKFYGIKGNCIDKIEATEKSVFKLNYDLNDIYILTQIGPHGVKPSVYIFNEKIDDSLILPNLNWWPHYNAIKTLKCN